MKQLLDLAFTPANLLPTIFLLFTILYWVVFILGMLDLSFLDFEMDKNLSLDKEIGIGKEIGPGGQEVDAAGKEFEPGGKSFGLKILHFFNLGEIPFMLFFSVFSVFFWSFSILGNHYLHGGSFVMVLGTLVGGGVASALLTKVITQPLRKIFGEMGKGEEVVDLRGHICVLELSVEGSRLGQADVVVRNKHMLITVKSDDGTKIERGRRCVIIEKSENGEYHTVQVLEIDKEDETIE
jgi:uncharacterized protein YbjQ (UPF0145 family)